MDMVVLVEMQVASDVYSDVVVVGHQFRDLGWWLFLGWRGQGIDGDDRCCIFRHGLLVIGQHAQSYGRVEFLDRLRGFGVDATLGCHLDSTRAACADQ